MTPNLSAFDNSWYNPGRSLLVRAMWLIAGLPLLRSTWIPGSRFRGLLLRLFGAHVGDSVVIKPGVRVKYPWRLWVGNNTWIGEDTWIDNLAAVCIGSNVCVSQGAYLCTGNHDWADPSFSLIIRSIVLESGSWIGARSVICPGVTVGECGIASAGSVVSKDIGAYEIHAGNPAACVRYRQFCDVLPIDQPILRA